MLMSMVPYVVAPLVGSVIGYITNDIAIRMLFRPHKPKYLWGWKLPFTPGIIPKEKGRIAASVGNAISANLINREVLEKNLLSQQMMGKIGGAVDRFFEKQRHNKQTLRQWLAGFVGEDDVNSLAKKTSDDLTSLIYTKLASSDVGNKIAHAAVKHVMEKMQHFGSGIGDRLAEEGIGHGGGFGDMIGRGIRKIFGRGGTDATSRFIDALAEPVEQALAANINEMLTNKSHEIVGTIVAKETDAFLDRTVESILDGKDKEMARVRQWVLATYRNVIEERLPRILAAVDISKIVETRINEMDMDEAEKIILDVMRSELKAIVWLGAGLGFLMGFVNCLLM